MAKNPPAGAGDTGWTSGPGRFHMPSGQLSPCATTPEPAPPRVHAPNKRSYSNESLHTTTRESPSAAKRHRAAKKQKDKYLKI